jgi:hypothetical protein
MCVVTPIQFMKHKYELLLNDRKMSESVEIVKSRMFYLIGTCPHLFFVESISVFVNLKLYFGIFSLS